MCTEQILREALYFFGRGLGYKKLQWPPTPPEPLPLAPFNPKLEEIPLTMKCHPEPEKVTAIGEGIGLAAGTGVGAGVGVSIDVEYRVPKKYLGEEINAT